MRDNRGVNRMVEVLNSGVETGNSSNLIPKSSVSVDAVLKERNTNDATSDSTKTAHDTLAKETKANDAREFKLNAQCASDSNVKHSSSQRNKMMSLDVDEIDYDEDEDDDDEDEDDASDGENDSQNAMMDVDEPNESLYVTSDTSKKYNLPKASDNNDKEIASNIIEDDDDDDGDDEPEDSAEEEEKSIEKRESEHESAVVVNGINNKNGPTSNDAVDKEKLSDSTVKPTTSKAVKRKASISSDGDQAPPAKA